MHSLMDYFPHDGRTLARVERERCSRIHHSARIKATFYSATEQLVVVSTGVVPNHRRWIWISPTHLQCTQSSWQTVEGCFPARPSPQFAKPVLMADSAALSMEPIAAAQSFVPQVVELKTLNVYVLRTPSYVVPGKSAAINGQAMSIDSSLADASSQNFKQSTQEIEF